MKILLIAILLVIPFLLITCKIWGEDSDVGGQICDRYDQAVNVGFATASTVDSVQFFMNGIQVCTPHDYDLFQTNRGAQGFQGLSYFKETTVMEIFECSVGTICDHIDVDLNDLLIVVYSLNQIDSIPLTKDGLAQMAFNKAYRVFSQSDSSFMFHLERADHFTYKGCQGEFCIAELSSESLLCIDAHSDTPKKVFKNICENRNFFDY